MGNIYTKDQLQQAVNNSNSLADIFRNLEIKINTGSYPWMRKILEKNEIDISRFYPPNKESRQLSLPFRKIDITKDDISTGERVSLNTLKNFLNFHGTIEKCNTCQITHWNGCQLRLDIDHIDGNCNNNHINNLQYLCPNCHRQKTIPIYEFKEKPKPTPNNICKCGAKIWAQSVSCKKCRHEEQRRISTIEWPNKEELENLVWEIPLLIIGRNLGVSDNAIRKKCKSYGVRFPNNGYWANIRAGNLEKANRIKFEILGNK